MESQLQALIGGLLDRGLPVTVVSRTLRMPAHHLLHWRRIPGPARPFAVAYPWFALIASLALTRERRGLLHTTGAIVFNRADVCTIHYLHNGRAGSLKRAQHATFPYRLNAAIAAGMSRLAERVVYSTPALSQALVAVSQPLAEELRQGFPARAEAIRVIENGVDTERFRPDKEARGDVRHELGIGGRSLLAVFVGSEWHRKGVEIAIEALVVAPSWRLVVVGRGDTQEASRTAERLGVGTRLHLVPESTAPERYYAAADAFVLPSAYESFSIAAFEAAASGLPVVATDVGAIGEIVNAGGGVFIDRSADSLGEALREIEASRESAAAMCERARFVAERFSWEAVVQSYLDLYREGEHTVRSLSPQTVVG